MTSEYDLRVTEIAVYQADKFPLHFNATRVQLAGDSDGGYFIRLEQEDQAIEIDPEEFPLLIQAANTLLQAVSNE